MMSTRDGLLWVADISPQGDGTVRVTVLEMVGQRGYLKQRMSTARSLAKRAAHMAGSAKAGPVHYCQGQERITFTVAPREVTR